MSRLTTLPEAALGGVINLPAALYYNDSVTGMAVSVKLSVPSDQTQVPVRVLMQQGTGYALTTTNTSTPTNLSNGTKGVSIYARNSDAYFSIGSGSATASATTGYIAQGERLDYDCSRYDSPVIAVITGAAGTAAILMVTELS